MALRIIRSNESIKVDNITLTIYSLPGYGKSTVTFTAGKVLLLDTDKGSYRAGNRGDVVVPKTWSEIANIEASDLDGYDVVALDTVGRALDMLGVHLLDQDPKLGRKSGDLSLQGFGALKSAFKSWNDRIHSLGKDVVLISHMDEKESDGIVKERFDIQGGSKSEIYKSSDAIAKLYIDSKGRRVLDFSPREGSLGKNPAGFDLIPVPDFRKEPLFLAGLLANIKASLNQMSETHREQNDSDQKVRTLFSACKTEDDFNAALPQLKGTSDAIKHFAIEQAVSKGLTFSKEAKRFVAVQTSQAPQSPLPSTQPPNVAGKAPSATGKANPATPSKADDVRFKEETDLEHCPPKLFEGEDDHLTKITCHVSDVEKRRKKSGGEYWLMQVLIEGDPQEVPVQVWDRKLFDAAQALLGKDAVLGCRRSEKDDKVYYALEVIYG